MHYVLHDPVAHDNANTAVRSCCVYAVKPQLPANFEEDTWAKLRPGNSQSAVQYSTLLSEGIQLLQLAAAEHCAVTALCRAVMLHPCLMVVLDAEELMLLENSFLEQLEAAMGDRARPAPEQQQQ